MPEGHTLHRLARELTGLVGHEVAATSPQGRFEPGPLDGATVRGVEAYGKHLLLDGGPGVTLHVHLGMRGKWLRFAPVTGAALKQVRLRLRPTGADLAWDLIAPSTCELLDDGCPRQPGRRARTRPAAARRGRRRGPAAVAHLPRVDRRGADGPVRAGRVGNVFRAEVLHACRIAPGRPAGQVTGAELAGLWDRLRAMMARAVEDGRILTVDVPDGDRAAVPEAASRRVYKQAACYDCGAPVLTATLAGRTSYTCPRCQPR